MPLTRQRAAKVCGIGAGVGSIVLAGVHQGFGGPETEAALNAAGAAPSNTVPPLYLAQIEATWVAATLIFLLIGIGLVLAGMRRPGWLVSLGAVSAVWFILFAAAFLWAGENWNVEGAAPQVFLLGVLGALSGAAALLAAPRRVARG
jgi:multisubunit Na+/H+ antiporter MnhB subunit